MRYGKTIETEMLRFEPEAMRAFVKYKPLKKLIAQSVHKESVESESTSEQPEKDIPSVENNAKAMATFIETLIEDVIAANQYYNLKFGTIESKYNELFRLVETDLLMESRFCCFIKRDSNILSDIYEILGEMLLLQDFAAMDYNGIRKIIKKFKKVTKSTAVDNVMTIINNSPIRDISAQNDLIADIVNLYLVRREEDYSRKHQSCFSKARSTYEEMLQRVENKRDPGEIKELKEKSMKMIIDRNLAVPGKNALRDMVFRGYRVLKSRIPKRTTEASSSTEDVADSMLIQMAFYMIPAELYSNENGEVLDSSETVLWEGELFRRFSALNQWKPRYVIISNKRLCVFTEKYGAMKKTVLMCDLMSMYTGSTYRYNECLLMLTRENEAVWFASSDRNHYQSFLKVVQHLYSLVVLSFFKGTSLVSSPSTKHIHSSYTSVVQSLHDHTNQSFFTQQETKHLPYTSITNLFEPQALDDHRSRSLSNLSPSAIKQEECLYLPILEESQVSAKLTSKRIIRDVYSVNNPREVWSVLQQFDQFVNSKLTEEEESGMVDFETTKKREVGKIIEAMQEAQASSPYLWSPYLKLHAISILRWTYPDLSALLQGKEQFQDVDIKPIDMNINKVYRYERQIGEGRYSSVWIVQNKQNNTFYAMKKIETWTLDPYERQAISREVYNMLLLRGHPNIVKFFGFFEDGSYYYIVMELASGGRLFDYIKSQKSFTEADAQRITQQLISAVRYCHEHEIVHRDLKPQNILLAESDNVNSIKLTDFGFSLTTSTHQLKTSLGTPGYTAPEVMRNRPYTSAVDMWSLGVIVYILLCGYPPFPSDNEMERVRCVSTATFQFYPNEWNSISQEAKDFIKKLIVVNPADRLTAEKALSDPWLSKETSQVNLPRVIQGISTIQKKFELQMAIQNPKHETRTHLVKTQRDNNLYALTDIHSTVVGMIPADHPIEISSEVMVNEVQFGLLTDYSKEVYSITSPQAWVILQDESSLSCVHALTYIYSRISKDSLPIYSSPLSDSFVVGSFTSSLLICDTLLDINGVQWAVLHHSMYTSLKLNGVPQAWIVLRNHDNTFFEKVGETDEYVERLNRFRRELNK